MESCKIHNEMIQGGSELTARRATDDAADRNC